MVWQALSWVNISAIFCPALSSRFKHFLPPRLYLYAARIVFVTAAAENWLDTAHPALKWLFAAETQSGGRFCSSFLYVCYYRYAVL